MVTENGRIKCAKCGRFRTPWDVKSVEVVAPQIYPLEPPEYDWVCRNECDKMGRKG